MLCANKSRTNAFLNLNCVPYIRAIHNLIAHNFNRLINNIVDGHLVNIVQKEFVNKWLILKASLNVAIT